MEQIWAEYDENKNGKLDKDECYKFLKSMLKEMTGRDPTESEIERNFMRIDLDKSGDVDKEEAYKYLKGFHVGRILIKSFSSISN